MTEWDLQPRAHACTACEQPFADRATYHTLLRHGADGYGRQDLCGGCFPKAGRGDAFSYWQAVYKTPPPPPPEPIQKETAETLLRKLVASPDPAHAATRYILAVMLERKRILKHRDTVREENGAELLVYEHPVSGESFTIPDPHLRLDELETVQREVSELLQPKESGDAPECAPAPAPSEPIS